MAYQSTYDRVLATWEVNEVFWNPGIITNGLVTFLPMWINSGTEIDLSGTGNDAAESSTTAGNANGPPIFQGGGLPL